MLRIKSFRPVLDNLTNSLVISDNSENNQFTSHHEICKMSELAAKLDNLSLGDDRAKMLSYICRAKASKKYFACKNSCPRVEGNIYLEIANSSKEGEEFQSIYCEHLFRKTQNIYLNPK